MSTDRLHADPELIEELRRKIAIKQDELTGSPAPPGLVPLVIACRMSSCRNGRHCLDYIRKPRAGDGPTIPGTCRDCGVRVADLPEPGGQRYGDLQVMVDTCAVQQNELIRAHYWHVPIDLWAYNRARRLGRRELYRRVEERVASALTRNDAWAGRQTPYNGDVIAYAQHAVAGCCRQCAAYWHGLPKDSAPSPEQIQHVAGLVRAYLDCRLPELADEPAAAALVGVISTATLPGDRKVAELDSRIVRAVSAGADPTGLVVAKGSTIRLTEGRDETGGFVVVTPQEQRAISWPQTGRGA